MTPEERTLISSLFDRLVQASNQPKDLEAEQLIQGKVSENPAAPYLLAQSALVLQQALTNAQNRISDLEKQLTEAHTQSASKPGGFLSGIAGFFGGSQPNTPPVQRPAPQPPTVPVQQQYQQPPYPYPPHQQAGSGMGGFLSGALTTAAGVAGGALLFRGIEGLLSHNPGPFTGAVMPSGGSFGLPAENNTEIINNYYTDGEHQTPEGQQFDQASDQNDPDPDPVDYASDDSNPDFTDNDFGNDGSGFGGGDDSSYV